MENDITPKATPKERLDEALTAAEEAFWAMIAERFPEIKTGDLPPEIVIPLSIENEKAVCYWLGGNGDNFPSFPENYIRAHQCEECGEADAPAGVKLCELCKAESGFRAGDRVLYDVFPHGIDIPGEIVDDKDNLYWLGIKTIGEKAKEFEASGVSTVVAFKDAQNVRKI